MSRLPAILSSAIALLAFDVASAQDPLQCATGNIIGEGEDSLLSRFGTGNPDVIEFQVADPTQLDDAVAAVAAIGTHEPSVDRIEAQVQVPVTSPVGVITQVVRKLDEHEIRLRDLHIRRPTLDDVFLTVTGHRPEDEEAA